MPNSTVTFKFQKVAGGSDGIVCIHFTDPADYTACKHIMEPFYTNNATQDTTGMDPRAAKRINEAGQAFEKTDGAKPQYTLTLPAYETAIGQPSVIFPSPKAREAFLNQFSLQSVVRDTNGAVQRKGDYSLHNVRRGQEYVIYFEQNFLSETKSPERKFMGTPLVHTSEKGMFARHVPKEYGDEMIDMSVTKPKGS